mmetsp:Transcript_76641/g.139371  ORF Transcript_76641/g.139371 Transcript_76641/m.139371 type:complete len:938 (+) Transcript_76641:92-2905(+)
MASIQPPPVKPIRGSMLQKHATSPRMTFPRVAHFSAHNAPVVKTPVHSDLIVRSTALDQQLRGGSSGPSARPAPSGGSPMMNSRAVSSTASGAVPPIRGPEISRSPQSESRTLVWKEMPAPSIAAPPGPPSAATAASAATPVASGDVAQAHPDSPRSRLVAPRQESPREKSRMVSAGAFLAGGMSQASDIVEGKRRVDPPKVSTMELDMMEGKRRVDPPKVSMMESASPLHSPAGRRRFTMPASCNILRPDFLPESQCESDKSKKKQFASRNRSPSPLDLPREETSRKGQPYNTRSTPSLMFEPRPEPLMEGLASVGSILSSPHSSTPMSRSYQPPPRQPEEKAAGQAPHNTSSGVATCMRSNASSWKPMIRPSLSKSPGQSGANSPTSVFSQDSAIVKGIFQDNTPFKSHPTHPGWRPHQDSSNVKSVMSRDEPGYGNGDSRASPGSRSPRNDSRNMNGILSPVSEVDSHSQHILNSRRQRSPDNSGKNVSSNVAACLSPIGSDRHDERRPGSKSPGSDARSMQQPHAESRQRSPSPWATDLEVTHEAPAGDTSNANNRLSVPQKVELSESKGPVRHRINNTTAASPEAGDRVVDSYTSVPRKGRQSPRAQMERVNLSPPPWARHNEWVDDEVPIRLNRNHNLNHEPPPWARRSESYDPDPLLEAKMQLSKMENAPRSSSNTPTPRTMHSTCSTPRQTMRQPSASKSSRSPGKSPSERNRYRSQRSWLEKVHTRLEGAILHAESIGPGSKAGQYPRSNAGTRYEDLKSNAAQRPKEVESIDAERTTSGSSTTDPEARDRDLSVRLIGQYDAPPRNMVSNEGRQVSEGPPSVVGSESPYVNRGSIHDIRRSFRSESPSRTASCSGSPYPGKRDYEPYSTCSSEYGFQYRPRADMIGQAVDQIMANKAGEKIPGQGSPRPRRRPGSSIFQDQTSNGIY